MSAIIIDLTPEAAWMAVDGATYRYGEGRADSFQQKAHPLVHLNAVVSVRGPQAYAQRLRPILSARFDSFEDLADGLHLAVWILHDEMEADMAALYGNAHVEVYVAGWSHARARAEAYVVVSHDAYGEPWTRHEIIEFACAPGVEPSAETDVPAAVVDVIKRQRLERDEHGHCGLGGHVQLVKVTPLAIHSSIIHRFPDQIGEPLGEAA